MKLNINYLITFLCGLYGIKLFWFNKVIFYINARYVNFFVIASFLCLVIGIAGLLLTILRSKSSLKDMSGISVKSLIIYIPLVLLLMLGLFLKPKSLTSSFVGQKPAMITYHPLDAPKLALAEKTKNKQQIDYDFNDWYLTFSTVEDLSKINGAPVKLIGLVSRKKEYQADVFLLTRFVLTCCAIDATPTGFPVKSSLTESFKADDWVEVTGKFTIMKDRNNQSRFFIVPEKIEQANEPENPYVYDLSWYYFGLL